MLFLLVAMQRLRAYVVPIDENWKVSLRQEGMTQIIAFDEKFFYVECFIYF